MHVDLHKQSHVLFFVIFLPAVSYGIGWLCAQLVPNAPFWMETVSPLAAYGLLFKLFDTVIWHWPIFRWLGIVGCPDVRGRWLGQQVSSVVNGQKKHITSRVIMEISQTFSDLHVQSYYHNWHSSTSAAQFISINNVPNLVIMFESEPKADYDGAASSHRGVTKLVQAPDTTLSGTYFNASGHHGELKFRRTTHKLYHTFDSIKPNS